ncbi:ATP-binding cassette domain-containing protein [Leuconostoc mesenteroides]|uniref:ATP-binding cassette domain-containing protein n=1 Tax=Leuconostoc mesenteroides TaxID=1245 RepID=UPI000E093DAE|nr:ABC transporter ATP-binding protein [Leuconostoc mesenteroides]MCJ2159515.1 energy-coupling factor ABC transporter ATP-binding protein [Leuconostoc mesenteroides]MCM6835174.1 energy-coupling factor ABC transporter ATP-binding protein [Leuconostoc mesenteroides]RDG15593.1 ABC transporter ATP-binding protein [Leuconostoc mesenteroides subsp. mesenteroides]GLX33352.1 ABC transporter ATP-binding protein [Leuconostoc mesenteroides subsp. dextranicum]
MVTHLKHISLSYGNTKILDDTTMSLSHNSFNLLIGPSGSGKSTLLRIFAGLYPQLKGEVLVNDQAVTTLPANEKAKVVGFLFQDPDTQFVMKTPLVELIFTLENLQVHPSDIKQRATHALEFVGISDLTHQDIDTLSGGEKQKVALAIIVAMQSDFLLLDEPFANIDSQSRQDLLAKLKDLQIQGQTTILITDHDLHGYEPLVDHVWEIHHKKVATVSNFQNRILPEQNVHLQLPKEGVLQLKNFELLVGQRQLISISDLPLSPGGITLFTGANGTGKSSLFNALTRLKSYQGDILYIDQNIKKFNAAKYAKQVALIFQNAERQFLRMTIREEIALSMQHAQQPEKWSENVITRYLERLNLDGLQDHVVYQLSGGQKKKVQLLVMLIVGTPILLLDEPIAGLDTDSVRVVGEILREIADNGRQRFIIISHQLDQLRPIIDYHLHLSNRTLQYMEHFL